MKPSRSAEPTQKTNTPATSFQLRRIRSRNSHNRSGSDPAVQTSSCAANPTKVRPNPKCRNGDVRRPLVIPLTGKSNFLLSEADWADLLVETRTSSCDEA